MIQLLFWQTTPVTTQAVADLPTTKINLWEMLSNGGPLMIPLAILLVLTVFFFIERTLAIRRASKIEGNFMNIIRDHIINGNVSAARSITKNTNHPVARIIDKGIQRIGKPIEAIEKSMETVGKLEMYKMERNVGVLSMIAGIAPMFGFLGTIIGMIQMFYGINSTGKFELNQIAGGIYVKMITSASGLIIGLLAYLAYSWLNAQVDATVNKMEASTNEFLDILQEPQK